MNIYTADVDYCNYLHYYEPKIPYVENEKKTRPFIGVVLCVNEKNYFAPMSSPKQKHILMKNRKDFIQICNGKLGGINLNDMMPIPRRFLNVIDIDKIEDVKYKKLLYMQINWIDKNKLIINNKARNLYYLITGNRADERLINRCCNFKLLEKKCEEFMKNNSIKEDEILYSF